MKLQIQNFRSIKDASIDVAPITVVYGQNGAGKSSLLYSLLTLRNACLNPNQNPYAFFNYGFCNLGGYETVVFDHDKRNDIKLGLLIERDEMTLDYDILISESEGIFSLNATTRDHESSILLDLPVSFPYPLNQTVKGRKSGELASVEVNWNGVTAQVRSESLDMDTSLASLLNTPVEWIRSSCIAPLGRGFTKPQYSAAPEASIQSNEERLAINLSKDKHLVSKISFYLEELLDRDFRVNSPPGTGLFTLDVTDKRTGVACELVNDGFGVNQLVYILALCLHSDSRIVCIEEPEIHLHPSAIRRLAKALVRIIREEGPKEFIISTHSETFLSALLALVSEGELDPAQLNCYWARKDLKTTKFELQPVNDKGQIEGGLTSFLEAELEDLKSLLGISN